MFGPRQRGQSPASATPAKPSQPKAAHPAKTKRFKEKDMTAMGKQPLRNSQTPNEPNQALGQAQIAENKS